MEQDRASDSIHNHSYGIWNCNVFVKALKMVGTGLIGMLWVLNYLRGNDRDGSSAEGHPRETFKMCWKGMKLLNSGV